MADKKTMTKKQRRIRRKRRRRRILFALEILVLLVLVGCLFVYAKLNSLDFVNIDLSNIGISDTVKNNEVMQGYTTIGLVGVDSRDGDLEAGCRKALEQIDERRYTEFLTEDGMTKILKYGVACYKKKCRVMLG